MAAKIINIIPSHHFHRQLHHHHNHRRDNCSSGARHRKQRHRGGIVRTMVLGLPIMGFLALVWTAYLLGNHNNYVVNYDDAWTMNLDSTNVLNTTSNDTTIIATSNPSLPTRSNMVTVATNATTLHPLPIFHPEERSKIASTAKTFGSKPHLLKFPPFSHYHTTKTLDKTKKTRETQEKQTEPQHATVEQQYLCVPQKNGNRQMAGLLYALWNNGNMQDLSTALQEANLGAMAVNKLSKYHKHFERLKNVPGRIQDVFFVTRNPYTRLLSLYLDKSAPENQPKEDFATQFGLGANGNNWTFAEFVQSIHQRVVKKQRIAQDDLNDDHNNKRAKGKLQKLRNQKRKATTLCGINHHLCQQVDVCIANTVPARHVYILKLEDQAQWFGPLLQATNVPNPQELLQGPQYIPFSGYPCYYTPTGHCPDMLNLLSPSLSNSSTKTTTTTTVSKQPMGVVTGHQHPTGASNPAKMAKYYNSTIAQMVTELYHDDLTYLKSYYPIWDGTTTKINTKPRP